MCDTQGFECGADDICFSGLYGFTLSEHIECEHSLHFNRCSPDSGSGHGQRGLRAGWGEEGGGDGEVTVGAEGSVRGGGAGAGEEAAVVEEEAAVFMFCAEEDDECRYSQPYAFFLWRERERKQEAPSVCM